MAEMIRTSTRDGSPLASHRLDFTAFEKAQQMGLHLEAHFPYLVEEDCASVRGLQSPDTVPIGACEAAAGVPEQLGFEQRLCYGRAIHCHERPTGSCGV